MAVNVPSLIIATLKADSVVTAAVGNVTVYGQTVPAIIGGEIDDEWAKLMPRRLVIVRSAGGTREPDNTPRIDARIDIRCYGKDPGGMQDAEDLSVIIYEQLHGKQDLPAGLGAIVMSAGPTPGRDPDDEWPYNLRTYEVLAEG